MPREVSISAFVALLFALFTGACATLPPLAPFDIGAPGWEVRRGQAVWKPRADAPEIVGDVLLAWNERGDAVAQFSKTLPLVEALLAAGRWQFNALPEDRSYSGRGLPPARIVWFQLLSALRDSGPRQPWTFSGTPGQGLLRNEESQEWLEVYLE